MDKEFQVSFRKKLKFTKSSLLKKAIFKDVIKKCGLIKKCRHCDAFNGKVKHQNGEGATLIQHDRYKYIFLSYIFYLVLKVTQKD